MPTTRVPGLWAAGTAAGSPRALVVGARIVGVAATATPTAAAWMKRRRLTIRVSLGKTGETVAFEEITVFGRCAQSKPVDYGRLIQSAWKFERQVGLQLGRSFRTTNGLVYDSVDFVDNVKHAFTCDIH